MARRPSKRSVKIPVARLDAVEASDGELHIGPWIAFMGKRQGKVAAEAGMSEGYLSALISGKHDKDPTLSMLKAVARAIGVPVQALFTRPPTREQIISDIASGRLPSPRK